MNILQFIETQYPIKDKVAAKLVDPYDRVANNDDLPYDVIGPDESGHFTKLVEVDDSRFVSVVDLISYSREDVVAMNDPAMLVVWENYMSQIDLKDLNITDILDCVKAHRDVVERRREQLDVLLV